MGVVWPRAERLMAASRMRRSAPPMPRSGWRMAIVRGLFVLAVVCVLEELMGGWVGGSMGGRIV